jgi:hypothetical protein
MMQPIVSSRNDKMRIAVTESMDEYRLMKQRSSLITNNISSSGGGENF